MCGELQVQYHVLNPKSITLGELYGEFNELTQVISGAMKDLDGHCLLRFLTFVFFVVQEWKNGLASSIIQQLVADESEVRHCNVGRKRK